MIDLSHLRIVRRNGRSSSRAGPDSFKVRLIDIPSSPADRQLASSHLVCNVCASNIGRYTCPRCLMPYCGAKCYSLHDVRCTESFFRAHVEGFQRLGCFVSEDNSNPRGHREGPGDRVVGRGSGCIEDALDDWELDSTDASESESRLEKIVTILLNCDYDVSFLPEDDRRYLIRLLRRRSLEICPVRPPWWAVTPLVTYPDTSSTFPTELGGESFKPILEAVESSNDEITKVRVGISQNISLFSDIMRAAAAAIRSTKSAQRLLNQEPNPTGHQVWVYQVIGMLLGYVVTMRSLNDPWSFGLENFSMAREAFDIFVASTPAVHSASSFHPRSLADAIGAWTKRETSAGASALHGGTYSAPPVLRDLSPRSICAVLDDVAVILERPYYANYALLDIWILACFCDSFVSKETTEDIGGGFIPNASLLARELRRFESDVFSKPGLKRESCEIVSRKAFFLLLRTVCDEFQSVKPSAWANSLLIEMREYISAIQLPPVREI